MVMLFCGILTFESFIFYGHAILLVLVYIFYLFYFQVFLLLRDVDSDFIEKYIPRKNLLSLSCFLVTPNCHRVTEVPYAISKGNQLSFVSIFLFRLSCSF